MALPKTKQSEIIKELNEALRKGVLDTFSQKRYLKDIRAIKKADTGVGFMLEGILATLMKDSETMICKFQNAVKLAPNNCDILENFFISMGKFCLFQRFKSETYSKWTGDHSNPKFKEISGMLGVFTGDQEILKEFPIFHNDSDFWKVWVKTLGEIRNGFGNLQNLMGQIFSHFLDNQIFLIGQYFTRLPSPENHLVITLELDPEFTGNLWVLEEFCDDLVEQNEGMGEILTIQLIIGECQSEDSKGDDFLLKNRENFQEFPNDLLKEIQSLVKD